MILHEYEARNLFLRYGIKVEDACLADSPDKAKECCRNVPAPYIVKAQVRVWSRGKLGLIKTADTPREVYRVAKDMLSKKFKGRNIDKILISHRVKTKRELYLSILLDRDSRSYTIMAGTLGGVDIEDIAKSYPKSILQINVNPLIGLNPYVARYLSSHLKVDKESIWNLVGNMYRLFIDNYCELVEVNPLVLSGNELIAVDRKIVIDDSAARIYSHLRGFWEQYLEELTKEERLSIIHGFSYVELEGNIGTVGNGAGLTMTSMDLIYLEGGRPGAFLDLGGGANAERVRIALEILMKNPRIEIIFVNILGGITRCDEVARGIVSLVSKYRKPIVVRLAGLRENEGRKILENAGIKVFSQLQEAIREVVYYGSTGG